MTVSRCTRLALVVASAAGSFVAAAPQETRLPEAVSAAAAAVDSTRIRSHVRFLANDLLEGRGTGSRGGELAAQYLATQFEALGLQPAGDDGSFLQRVRFAGTLTEDRTRLGFAPMNSELLPLKLGDDYVASNHSLTNSVTVDAPIVFVGYGIQAPEYGWDDYAGVDVRGKVALIIVNEPPSSDPKFFNGEALTYYGRWTYKYEQAARKGAIGALIIHRDDLASYPWQVVKSSWSNEAVVLADDPKPKLKAAAWIQLEVARLLMAVSGQELDAMIEQAGTRQFQAFELPTRLQAQIESRVRKFESSNVVAMLPAASAATAATTAKGKDPAAAAARKAVLYSAHYDHLGIDAAMPGDNIYNGAVDNATGCAVILEIARVLASLKDRPQPVLFAAVTAEEKNLLGSQYLGEHPPLPLAQIALNLNFDSIAPLGTPQSVKMIGAERLSFYPIVERMAAGSGLGIEPDSRPLAGSYYRSDHFSMARVGVPAFSVSQGNQFAGQTRAWGEEQARDYTAKHYHQPSDEYRDDMDFTGSRELARFGLALGWAAMTSPAAIVWQPGDEFEAARLRSARAPLRPR